MSTELPYAADAELSLSYDELEVRIVIISFHRLILCRCFANNTKKNSLKSTSPFKPSSTFLGAWLRVLNEKIRLKE